MKRKRKPNRQTEPLPQDYQERVEVALEAVNHALSGCQRLVEFVLAENGPGAPRYPLATDAKHELERALHWLKKVNRSQA